MRILRMALQVAAFAALASPAPAQDDCSTTTIGEWQVQYGSFCEELYRELAAGGHRIGVALGFDFEHRPETLWIANMDPGAGTLNNVASSVTISVGGRDLGSAEADITGYVFGSAATRRAVEGLREGQSAVIAVSYNSGEVQVFAFEGAGFAAAYARAVPESAPPSKPEFAPR